MVATKGDKTTEKTYTYTMGENKPELSVSPNDGDTFKDTLEITVTAENIEEATYQVGEEAAVSFSGTKTITIGKNMQDGDVVKVKVYGKSSNGKEDIVTAAFTKEEEDNNTGTCIYFKNTKDWNPVNAYVWKDETTNHAEWPGKTMELFDKENQIYSLDLGTDVTYKNVIFNTNGGSQTADLALPGLGQLYDPDTGKWSQYGEQGLKISSSLTSRNIKGETEVTFQTRAAKSAEISVNEGTAEKFTDSINITVGKDLKPGEEDIVKVIASDGTDKITRTFIYTMEGMSTGEERPDVSPTPNVDPTSSPNQTVEPQKTDEPENSEKPDDTIAPERTNTPSEEPPAPNVTKTPDVTQTPDINEDVRNTATPAPNVTKTPDVTQTPDINEDVKNTATPVPTETAKPLQPTPIINKVVVDKVTFNPGVTQVAKKTVKINMKAKGGSGKYLYSLEISNSQGAIVASINESKNNTYSWTPKKEGTYEVYVDIKDTQTGITSKGKIYKYVVVKKKLTITQVKISKKKIINQKNVAFTVTATGGKTKYKYAFTIKNAKGKVIKKIKYQSKKKINWKPSKTGKYTIYVSVKDATNTVKTKKKVIKVVKK